LAAIIGYRPADMRAEQGMNDAARASTGYPRGVKVMCASILSRLDRDPSTPVVIVVPS
jgi:hypothetical protein